jgi:hypothetical protein
MRRIFVDSWASAASGAQRSNCLDGMQNRQQLAHAGRERDLRRFTSGSQALIKPFEP